MPAKLAKEFKFYLKHQNEYVRKYKGKFVVIKGEEFLGAYDSEFEAIRETTKNHELGTFLIQICEPGTESYTHTFHSRVVFT